MAATPKTERVRKTPAERAQQALDVVQRELDRLQAKHRQLFADAAKIEPQIDAAKRRRDYLAQSPDLPQPTLDGDEAPEPRDEEPQA